MIDQSQKDNIEGLYSKVSRLGQGTYGVVYLYERTQTYKNTPFNNFFLQWRKPESNYFALKVYRRPKDNKQGVDFSSLRQITLLQSLNHPNVAACHDVIYKKALHKHEIYVVMDFHLELADVFRDASIVKNLEDKKNVCLQLVKGLAFLHENYIFHRDLKPENLFVSRSGRVKLADFGFAKEFGTPNKKYTTTTCTREYRAPEVFFETQYYTEKSDIWSLGCIFAYVFTGRSLFFCQSGSDLEIVDRIFHLRGTPDEQTWPHCKNVPRFYVFDKLPPKDLAQQLKIGANQAALITACLQLDPKKRPSAKSLIKSDFFKGVSDDALKVEELFQQKLKKIKGNPQ